jgi:hypothetical protein
MKGGSAGENACLRKATPGVVVAVSYRRTKVCDTVSK